jgi:hypothetical protein
MEIDRLYGTVRPPETGSGGATNLESKAFLSGIGIKFEEDIRMGWEVECGSPVELTGPEGVAEARFQSDVVLRNVFREGHG